MTVYIADDLPDDSDTQFIPEPQSTPTLQPGGDLLARSLQQLQEGLDSGTVMTQFEVSCRRCHSPAGSPPRVGPGAMHTHEQT